MKKKPFEDNMKQVAALFDDPKSAMELMESKMAEYEAAKNSRQLVELPEFTDVVWIFFQEKARDRRLENGIASPVSLLEDLLDTRGSGPVLFGGRKERAQNAEFIYGGEYDE